MLLTHLQVFALYAAINAAIILILAVLVTRAGASTRSCWATAAIPISSGPSARTATRWSMCRWR